MPLHTLPIVCSKVFKMSKSFGNFDPSYFEQHQNILCRNFYIETYIYSLVITVVFLNVKSLIITRQALTTLTNIPK